MTEKAYSLIFASGFKICYEANRVTSLNMMAFLLDPYRRIMTARAFNLPPMVLDCVALSRSTSIIYLIMFAGPIIGCSAMTGNRSKTSFLSLALESAVFSNIVLIS